VRGGWYRERALSVTVRYDSSTSVSIALEAGNQLLEQTAVTSGRREEKTLSSPASVSVLASEEILEWPIGAFTDHLRTFPGADVASGSLLQANVVTRGFNNLFNGSMLTLVDSRRASVPSLRANAPYLIPNTADDVERVELMLGPAAVLYGPNAADGVMHIITKSPFEWTGTTLSVESAQRSFFRGALRHAFVVGNRFAAKVSAEWLRAEDWESVDSVEAALIAQRTGARERDNDLRRIAGELRIDFRPSSSSEISATYGHSFVSSLIEPTAASGAAMADGWTYDAFRLRARWRNTFAQAYMNRSNAGNTFLLRSGLPVVDRSTEAAIEVQQIADIGNRLRLVGGVDLVRTRPVTDGTINGRFEDDDAVNEAGAYLHGVFRVSEKVDVVLSGRGDNHSELTKAVLSPRAAIVVRPDASQHLRFGYAHAFATPTNFDFFIDQDVQSLAAGLPYKVRALGVPSAGFRYRRDCDGGAGGLCMRSPFTPAGSGGAEAWAPTVATAYWQSAIDVALANPAAAGLLSLEATLRALQPTAQEVSTSLALLNLGAGAFQEIDAGLVADIARLRPTLSRILEVGYKGRWDRVSVGANAWILRRNDFLSAPSPETPSVFLDAESLRAFLETEFAARGVGDPAGSAALAAEALAAVPLGTVQMDNPAVSPVDVVLTFRNYGKVTNGGFELVGEYLVNNQLSVRGTYSHVSRGRFSQARVGGTSEISLNAPLNKGSLSVRYRDPRSSLSAELRGRFAGEFQVRSGVYDDHIRSYGIADVVFSWFSPVAPGFVVSLSASNLFDDRHREFAGGALLGRFVMTKIQYAF
jgi:iron complex outermembrane receptor protein